MRAVRGEESGDVGPTQLKKVSLFLPAELMWFWFKVTSLTRPKVWCKFFQVALSQPRFLAPGTDGTVACTTSLVADERGLRDSSN